MVSSKGPLGNSYKPGEVLRYKQLWEKRCEEASEGEIDEPLDEVHETKEIEGNGNEEYAFELEEGNELVFSISANDYLDAVICEQEDIEAWAEGEHDEDRPLPDGFWHRTGIMNGSDYRFVAPEDGSYVLLVINWDEDPTEVEIDAAVWAAQD